MKPNHTNFHRLLLYLLGELPPEEKKNVDKHLRTCRQCEKLMEEGKTLLRLMRQHTQPEPSDPLLEECRTHLRERIREESVRKTRQRLWTNIWDHIPFQIPTKQLVTATVLFLFGLILGRFLPNGGGPSQDAVRALQSSIPVGSFRVIPTEGQSDQVEIRFETVQEKILRGSLQDPDIRYVLSYALMNEPKDNIRLRTVDLLEEASKDKSVQKALIQTLKNDENPGVRLKALNVLKTLPVNENIKRSLLYTFFMDANSGVRIQAADALNQMGDPGIRSILQNKAGEDEYLRALISKTRKEKPVSVSREE